MIIIIIVHIILLIIVIITTIMMMNMREPCETGKTDNSEDEATDEDIDVSIHRRAVQMQNQENQETLSHFRLRLIIVRKRMVET